MKVIVSTPYGVTQAVNDVSFNLEAGRKCWALSEKVDQGKR
ncbi:hypothetical protein ACXM0N_14830 [Peribacillus simplex]